MGTCFLKRHLLDDDDDQFPYDYKIPMPQSGEVDFLYTADIHAGWTNFGSNRFGNHVFSLDKNSLTNTAYNGGDVKAYKEKLIQNGIPTYCIDAGDWSHGGNYTYTSQYSTEDAVVRHAIDMMNSVGYLGVTMGNHEFKYSNMNTCQTYIGLMNNVVACNYRGPSSEGRPIIYKGNTAAVNYLADKYPWYSSFGNYWPCLGTTDGGFKAIKVGSKKIGIIFISYPSPNGFETFGTTNVEYNSGTFRWNYKSGSSTLYTFYDGRNDAKIQNGNVNYYKPNYGTSANPEYHISDITQNLTFPGYPEYNAGGSMYRDVQSIIEAFKGEGFDYIIGIGHLDKYWDENYTADSRFYCRAEFLLKNTSGMDLFIPGHLNSTVNQQFRVKWYDESGYGMIAPEAGGELQSFGRVKIDLFNDTITCRLLQNTDHLDYIDINRLPAPDIYQ